MIAWFNEINEKDLPLLAGGKGASLCRMSRNGFPVPPGFIVTSQMFSSFMRENVLYDTVYRKLSEIDWDDYDTLENISAYIRETIANAPMPEVMEKQIITFYRELGENSPVAVRSSGTAEDLDDASFAGQQETFLYVIGEAEIIKYIKACWASLYNGSAIFYRKSKGFNEQEISIAVVVQHMVNSEKAGVMFSSNPITKDQNIVMIEGSWGLGESVVQGLVTPDNYLIDKTTFEETECVISEKETMVVRMDGGSGVLEREVPPDMRNKPVLSREEIKALTEMAKHVESFYQKPQDLEWAFEGGKLYLLQSRPITTI